MRFLSLCSGIEAASVAWNPLGWDAAAFAEIEKFPSAVLAHHYPNVPNLGDMTRFREWPDLGPIDLVCGGTPCQSYSIGGKREGLGDERGQLMLTYIEIVRQLRPQWLVWENVPGVLSSNGGRDFGTFLGLLEASRYGWAYRVIDAQFANLPQQRKRVFVVGYLGDWRCAAAVLFERGSLAWRSEPERAEVLSVCLTARGAGSLDDRETYIQDEFGIRHMTPLECERAMGFPDGYTKIPYRGKSSELCPDGPRYKALGNSWAVNVARWVGSRIELVEEVQAELNRKAA